jgi:hypothetical protein
MLRQVVGGVLGLVLCASLGTADDKQPQMIAGTIKKIDAKKGIMVVKTKDKDVDVKVTEGTKLTAPGRPGRR